MLENLALFTISI